MTVIIASLFVPYSVQFEVPDDYSGDYDTCKGENTKPTTAKIGNTSTKTPSSILPTAPALGAIPIAGESQIAGQDGLSSSGNTPNHSAENDAKTPESFFYNHNRQKKANTDTPLSASLAEKATGSYIQPKSRKSTLNFQSTITDANLKLSQESGSTSLKINRTLSNLSLANSNNARLQGPTFERAKTNTKQNAIFMLHNNASSTSIDEDFHQPGDLLSDNWKEADFNDLSDSKAAKLAPFGGFSNPSIEDQLHNQSSIFETAPWEVVFSNKGNVSLTKAVRTAVDAGVIANRKWVGTLAMPSDEVPTTVTDQIAKVLSEDYNSEVVFPSDAVFQGHYKSFCKQILWPTLHYQIPDDPKSKAFEDHSWGYYKELNQLVANKVIEVYKNEQNHNDPNNDDNMIWVHDYHLLLVPQMVRDVLPDAKIGLFLHVSFPSSEVFRCLAQRLDILNGMLGANCISFQTREYVRHFLQTCSRLLLADTSDTGLTHNDYFIVTNTIPVGINEKSLSKLVRSSEVLEWRNLIRERFHNNKIILSRDKIDKLRGIKQKLIAYEKFLKENPDLIESTVLIQICIGHSDDSEYEAEIMKIVGRINSLPENISDIPPVVFLSKDLEFDQYIGLQSEADAFIVSSQREGMNLTCHEFITATHEKKSTLILSEFAGSAPYLRCKGEGAVLINPWDSKDFSEKIKSLLNMSEEEKSTRWENQYEVVRTLDSTSWVTNCLKSINEAWERDQSRSTDNLKPLNQKIFEEMYHRSAGKRLLFVNLESPGAVIDLSDRSRNVSDKSLVSEPTSFINYLQLIDDPKNHVYIITFLKRSDLDIIYRRFPNVGLIAENGGYIKLVGSSKWLSIVDESEIQSWKPQVIRLIQSKVDRIPGSHCEVSDCTIKFHPGSSLTESKQRTLDAMGDCIQHINLLFHESEGVHAALIRNVVVVQQDKLALKAMKFIVSSYNQKKHGVETKSLIDEFHIRKISTSKPMDPTKSIDKIISSTTDDENIGFVLFCGGTTPLDEPSYEYLNELEAKKEIGEVLTVAIIQLKSENRTSATFCVNSKNEFLTVVSSIKP